MLDFFLLRPQMFFYISVFYIYASPRSCVYLNSAMLLTSELDPQLGVFVAYFHSKCYIYYNYFCVFYIVQGTVFYIVPTLPLNLSLYFTSFKINISITSK